MARLATSWILGHYALTGASFLSCGGCRASQESPRPRRMLRPSHLEMLCNTVPCILFCTGTHTLYTWVLLSSCNPGFCWDSPTRMDYSPPGYFNNHCQGLRGKAGGGSPHKGTWLRGAGWELRFSSCPEAVPFCNSSSREGMSFPNSS